MNITEFIYNYGTYVILIPLAIITILLTIGEIINYKNGIPVRFEKIFAVILMGFIGNAVIKIFTLPDKQQEPIKAFFKSIDWNFWGYYILFPCILTILIITIISAVIASKTKKNWISEVEKLKSEKAFFEFNEERFESKLPREMQLKIAENVEKVIIDLQDEIDELTKKNKLLESELKSLKKLEK